MSCHLPVNFRTFLFIPLLLLTFLAFTPQSTQALANHVVISEIQIAGTDGDDEFVELYNPTDSAIDLTGWRLSRLTSSGGAGGNLNSSLEGTIPAYGFFLIAPAEYDGAVAADNGYSTGSRLAGNNTVVLYSDAGSTVVDTVGMGNAEVNESAATVSPIVSESIERKALPSSTSQTMAVGGEHESLGNGEDTNDNSADFVVRNIPQPQNSASSPETPDTEPDPSPSVAPSPTNTPSPSLTPTPTDTPAPVVFVFNLTGDQEVPPVETLASGEATVTINPESNTLSYNLTHQNLSSEETDAHIHGPAQIGENAEVIHALPSGSVKVGVWTYPEELESDLLSGRTYINIHSEEYPDGEIRGQIANAVTPSPTPLPSPSPTTAPEASPTPEPSPTLTPSPSPIPTPTPTGTVMINNPIMTCYKNYRTITILHLTLRMPQFSCTLR